MRFKFDKPAGSHADTKELEYISALMQTCRPLRQDGSIEVHDTMFFLMSRYGIHVNEDVIRDEVFVQLAGDLDQTPTGVMDIRQIAAMLTIPHLAKLRHGVYIDSVVNSKDYQDLGTSLRPKGGEGHPMLVSDRSIEVLVNEIVADTQEDGLFGKDYEPVITRDFLRKIFEAHDEVSVADHVLDQMVEAVGGDGTRFNAKNFLMALTKDLDAWNVEWETRLSTAYADVLSLNASKQSIDKEPDEDMVGKGKSIAVNETRSNFKHLSLHSSDVEEAAACSKSFLEKTRKVFTFPEIDNTADTYGSTTFVVLLWAAFICVYISYVFSTGSGGVNVDCKEISGFGCQISNAIVNWFGIMAQLMALGSIFFFIGSLGNTIFFTNAVLSVIKVLASMAIIFVSTVFFFIKHDINNWFLNTTWEDQNVLFSLFNGTALGVGCILLAMQIHTLARLLIPASCVASNKTIGRLLLPGVVPKEVRMKKAAAYKVNRMIKNATSHHLGETELMAHKSLRSSGFMSGNGHAMFAYLGESYKTETTGGLMWGWKEFWSGRICFEEGIFFHSRLIASCLAQFLLIFLIIAMATFAFLTVDDLYRNAEAQGLDAIFIKGVCYGTECDLVGVAVNTNDTVSFENATFDESVNETSYEDYLGNLIRSEINGTLTSALVGTGVIVDDAMVDEVYSGLRATLYNVTGVDVVSVYSSYDSVNTDNATSAELLTDIINESDCYVAIGVGFFVSFCSIAGATLNYIPSFIMNVLKFRYGVIRSLDDQEFQRYKEGPDHPTFIFGIAFWSQLYTALISFVIAGLIAFFIVWNKSSDFILFIVAQLIGIFATLIPKIVGIMLFRSYAFAGYYRKKVAFSNIVFLLLECWNIAITAGFLLVRTVLLFLLATLYIGRIDTPFLADEVDKFDFLSNAAYLDRAPVYYRKDLLLHEAHRHPYIERLGALCLLKLNKGDSFGTRGGSAWRLLYVLTLMPWLKKYRATVRKMDYSSIAIGYLKLSTKQSTDEGTAATGGNLSNSVIKDSTTELNSSTNASKKEKNKRTSGENALENSYGAEEFIGNPTPQRQ